MRKVLPARLRSLLIAVIVLLASHISYASHIVGVDLNYAWDTGNTYKITLVAYGDCGPSSASAFETLPYSSPLICIYNGSTYVTSISLDIDNALSGIEITPVCPADSLSTQCHSPTSAIPGIKKYTYTGYYTVPSRSSVWRFLYNGYMGSGSGAGRAAAISNIGTGSIIQVIDTLNNAIDNHHNSNPILTVVPTPFFCLDNSDNYNPGAVDPDGDSLSFFLVPGKNGPDDGACGIGGNVTYRTPYTATAPMATSSFSFNQATGQISFDPSILQRALVVYNIEEYRHGAFGDTLVGTSQREMTFLVLTCTNTSPTANIDTITTGDGTLDDSTHYHICANSGPFSLSLFPHEPDTSNLITVTATGLPVGAVFSVTGNGTNHPLVTISWTSDGVPFGNYTFYLTFTDNNCPLQGQQTLAYTIGVYPIPTIFANIATPATCSRDSATVDLIPGGLGQPWKIVVSNGDSLTNVNSDTTVNLFPGTYTLDIYSGFSTQCNGSATVSIGAPSLSATGAFQSPTYCGNNDGSIILSGLNGGGLDNVNFQYGGVAQATELLTVNSGDSLVLGGLCAGLYDSIIVSIGVCTTTPVGPYDLVNPPYATISYTSTNLTACGYTNGTIILHGLTPGQTDTVNYTKAPLSGGTPVAQPPITSYVGADSVFSILGLDTGVYNSIVITTGGACSVVPPCTSNIIGPITLTMPYISPKFSDVIHYGCNGDTVVFTNLSTAPGSPFIQYTWNFGDGSGPDTVTNPSHIYLGTNGLDSVSLKVYNGGCDSTYDSTVNINSFISSRFTSDPPTFVCQDNVVTFTNNSIADSTFTYTWYFGDGNTTNVTSPTHIYPNTGNYEVMLITTNFVPCTDTAWESLAVDSNSVLSVHITDSTLCQGQAITLTGYYALSGLTNVTWTFGDGSTLENVNPVIHAYDTSGLLTVSVQVTYRACPNGSASKAILVIPNPQIDLGPDTSICAGGTPIVLTDSINNETPGATWLWSTGATTPGIIVNSPGNYYSTVTIKGCSASDSVWVQNDCYMDIPNAFTPNNDGTNDYFYPRQYLTKGLTTFKMDIYNRWGQNIFETTSLDGRGWDGSFNNTPQPEGVYIYSIDATFKDGQKEHRQGNITLLR